MLVFDELKDKVDTKKFITWKRDGPFNLSVGYADATTEEKKKELGTFNVELPAQPERKKVKIEAKVSLHGVFGIQVAEMVETEEYEETVKEKREVGGDAAMSSDAEGGADKGEKQFEWVDVVKKKKRTKRTPLGVTAEGRPGLPPAKIQEQKDVESVMRTEMEEVRQNGQARNDLETFIYDMKDRVISSSGNAHEYMKPEDRTTFDAQLQKAEDWIYDHEDDATTVEFMDKLGELQGLGNPVIARQAQRQQVKDMMPAVQDTIRSVRQKVNSPLEDYAHIAQGKKNQVVDMAGGLEGWMSDMQQKENRNAAFNDAVYTAQDLVAKQVELQKFCDSIMSEPRPMETEAPPANGDADVQMEGGHSEAAPAEEAAAAEGAAEEKKDEEPKLAPGEDPKEWID